MSENLKVWIDVIFVTMHSNFAYSDYAEIKYRKSCRFSGQVGKYEWNSVRGFKSSLTKLQTRTTSSLILIFIISIVIIIITLVLLIIMWVIFRRVFFWALALTVQLLALFILILWIRDHDLASWMDGLIVSLRLCSFSLTPWHPSGGAPCPARGPT